MRNPSAIMLVVAVLIGAVTVWMVKGFLEARPDANASSEPAIEMVKVVVASHSMAFGDTLHKDLLREVEWPREIAPEGTFGSISEILADGERRVALRNLEPNELILKSRVSGFGGKATLSQVITPGKRAAAIRVDDVVGVAGFVLPGDRVDILLTRQVGKDRNSLITDVLIQNVRVLAVDQLANDRSEDPIVAKATTVEVTPRQAQKLSLAARVGSLSLSLRNLVNGAGDPLMMRTVRVADLVPGISRAKPKKKVRRTVRRAPTSSNIKIIRGLEARTQKVKKEKAPVPKAIMQPKRSADTRPSSAPASDKSDNETSKIEPVAIAPGAREQEIYAAKGMPTVTTADLERSFNSADEQVATEAPFLIMRADSEGD